MTRYKVKGFEPKLKESKDIYELLDSFQNQLARYAMKVRLEGMVKSLPYWERPPYTGPNGELIYKVSEVYIRGVGYEVFVIINQEDNLFKIKDYYLTKKPEPPVPL
jgi:hypothetical protein